MEKKNTDIDMSLVVKIAYMIVDVLVMALIFVTPLLSSTPHFILAALGELLWGAVNVAFLYQYIDKKGNDFTVIAFSVSCLFLIVATMIASLVYAIVF